MVAGKVMRTDRYLGRIMVFPSCVVLNYIVLECNATAKTVPFMG